MKHYPKGDFVGTMTEMTDNDSFNRYIKNEITPREAFGGHLFETYGPDHQEVVETMQDDALAHKETRVDTILEEQGEIFVLRGYWAINRIGYLIRKGAV
jgi:hypothetical protein